MLSVLSSEWLKLRSVRSTHYLLAVIVAVVAGAAWMAYNGAHAWDDLPPEQRARFHAPPVEQALLPFVQLCVAILATLTVTGEYATGMLRTSVISVPRRRTLLAGKAGVVAGVAVVIGLAFLVVTFLLSRTIVGHRPISPGYTGPAAGEIPMLLTSGISVVVVALVAVGLGTVLRSTAGSIVAVAALLFVLPNGVRFLPEPWNDRIGSVLLGRLAGQLADDPATIGLLPPLGALAVMSAYVVVSLGAAGVMISRRDV